MILETNNNYNDHSDFSTSVNLQITAKKVSDDNDFWKITINPAMYTSRVNPEEVYTTSYDFRSLDNEINSYLIKLFARNLPDKVK